MIEVVVPDPEPEWEHALQYHGAKRNPVQQYFTFEQAMGEFRLIGILRLSLEDVARRLRLMIEPGHTDQLGPVDAAFFSVARTGYAVHRYSTRTDLLVHLHRQHIDTTAHQAFDRLLDVLGVDWRAVASVLDGEGHFDEPVLDADHRLARPDEAPGTGDSGF